MKLRHDTAMSPWVKDPHSLEHEVRLHLLLNCAFASGVIALEGGVQLDLHVTQGQWLLQWRVYLYACQTIQ